MNASDLWREHFNISGFYIRFNCLFYYWRPRRACNDFIQNGPHGCIGDLELLRQSFKSLGLFTILNFYIRVGQLSTLTSLLEINVRNISSIT